MLQATASEGLAKGPYVAARVGFEPATLRTQWAESTTGLDSSIPQPCTLTTVMFDRERYFQTIPVFLSFYYFMSISTKHDIVIPNTCVDYMILINCWIFIHDVPCHLQGLEYQNRRFTEYLDTSQ